MKKNNGFTLIEITVATTILSGLLYLLNSTLVMSDTEFDDQKARLDVSLYARRIVETIAEEIQNSALSQVTSVLPIYPTATNNITFKQNTGYTSAITWGNSITYSSELDVGETQNGTDDNGNGMVDEERVYKLYNNNKIYISGDVKNGTFKLSLSDNKIRVEVTIEKKVNGKVYTSTAVTSIKPRNI